MTVEPCDGLAAGVRGYGYDYDQLSSLPDEQRGFLQETLDQLHQQFISVVRTGRGERLKGGDEIFSGLFWSGEESVVLGLADRIGSSSFVARELIGAEKIVKYSSRSNLLDRFADQLGVSIATSLARLSGIDGYPVVR